MRGTIKMLLQTRSEEGDAGLGRHREQEDGRRGASGFTPACWVVVSMIDSFRR